MYVCMYVRLTGKILKCNKATGCDSQMKITQTDIKEKNQ